MEKTKILTADLLDLIFDDRNKEYGAYELRRSYDRRIKKALLLTFTIAALAIGGSVLAKTLKPPANEFLIREGVVISDLPPEEKQPEKIREPEKQPEPEPVRQEKLTTLKVVPNEEASEPIATQDEFKLADIGTQTSDGKEDDYTSEPVKDISDGKGIIDMPEKEPEIHTTVEVHARYSGNWEKFLLRNLNADVPRDNGAPPGRYTVKIQFVVDKEGSVSDIKPLTDVGYGMEDEAVRVLRKADLWEPAIQGGYKVKAYHTQLITFVIPEE